MTLVSASIAPVGFVQYYYHEGQIVQNFQVQYTTGSETITRTTNENGGIQIDLSGGSPDFDNIGSTLTVDCGFSVCNKQYNVDDIESAGVFEEHINLLERPPNTCPTCPSSSCSGGSVGVIYKATQELCETDFPCEDKVIEKYLPCDEKACKDITCNLAPCEDKCPPIVVCQQDDNFLAYLLGIIGILTGGASIYYLKRKDAKLPNGTFVKFGGKNGPLHLHRGIRGYHNPATSHREAHERHPKGEMDPKYEKDVDGVYRYVG